MRPDTGETYINDLTTDAEGGNEMKWKLENDSGISEITEIKKKAKSVDIFKYPPVAEKGGTTMVTEVVDAIEDVWIEGSYYIKYTLDDGTKVEIDPMLRIPPKR